MNVDRRLVGWGTFFILLGGIPLAARLGALDPQLLGQWLRLWPLLLIGWGLDLVLRRTSLALVGSLISVLTFGVMGGSALATGIGDVPITGTCVGDAAGTSFAARSGAFGQAARVNLELNCGTLAVGTADGSTWTISGSDGTGDGPDIDAAPEELMISSDAGRFLPQARGRAAWSVTLPRATSLALGVTLNAGEGTLDLAGADVSTLSMTLNAGAMTIDLGAARGQVDVNATVNAGSAALLLPAGDRSANLSLNAGAVVVCLPPDTPISVRWSGALGSNNFDAVGLTKVDGSTWTSPGLDSSLAHVDLRVSANAGSFELQFGGECRA